MTATYTLDQRITQAMLTAPAGTDQALVEATLQQLASTTIPTYLTAETPSRIAIEDRIVELAQFAAELLKSGDATNGTLDTNNSTNITAAMARAVSSTDKTALRTALLDVVNNAILGFDVLIGGHKHYYLWKEQFYDLCRQVASYLKEGNKT